MEALASAVTALPSAAFAAACAVKASSTPCWIFAFVVVSSFASEMIWSCSFACDTALSASFAELIAPLRIEALPMLTISVVAASRCAMMMSTSTSGVGIAVA